MNKSRCPKGSRRIGKRCIKSIKNSKSKKSPSNKEKYLKSLKGYINKLYKVSNGKTNYDYMYLNAKKRDINAIKDYISRIKEYLKNY